MFRVYFFYTVSDKAKQIIATASTKTFANGANYLFLDCEVYTPVEADLLHKHLGPSHHNRKSQPHFISYPLSLSNVLTSGKRSNKRGEHFQVGFPSA